MSADQPPGRTSGPQRSQQGDFSRSEARADYIDTLRGLAIAGVIACHTAVLFPDMPWRLNRLAGLGAHGVHLFFVASALTLSLSWSRRRDGAIPFYIRRLFRIAPMFWLSAAVYLLLDRVLVAPFWLDGVISPRNIVLTLLFSHGWSPNAINAVVPGGWTIAVEMTFYGAFPLLMRRITTLTGAWVFVLISVVLACGANIVGAQLWQGATSERGLHEFLYYWLPNSLPSFASGIVAFYLLPRVPVSDLLAGLMMTLVAIIGLYVAWGDLPFSASLARPISRGTMLSIGCVLLVIALHGTCGTVFVNRATILLGRVSYSAYLVHWLLVEACLSVVGQIHASPLLSGLLWIATVPVFVFVTTRLALGTYHCIERPGIRAGARLALRFQRIDLELPVVR